MIPIPGSREWLAGGQTGNPTPKCTGLRNARCSPAREWVRSQRADNWNIYYWNDRQSYSPSPSMRAGDVVPPASCSPNRGQPNIMQVVPSAELISQIKNLSGGYRFLLGSGSLICSFRIQQGQTRVFSEGNNQIHSIISEDRKVEQSVSQIWTSWRTCHANCWIRNLLVIIRPIKCSSCWVANYERGTVLIPELNFWVARLHSLNWECGVSVIYCVSGHSI